MKTKTHNYLARLLCVLSIIALASCGGGSPLPPAISSLTATATVITTDGNVDITPVFSGGTGVVDNAVGAVTSGTSFNVAPVATQTFTLTVTSAQGTATQSITITVVDAPDITSLTSSATADTISNGSNATLTANFTGDADNTGIITNDQDATTINVTSAVASIPVSPTITTIYTLTTENAAGAVDTQTITITVVPPVSISSFVSAASANADTITLGNSTTLTGVFSGDIDNIGVISNNQDASTINVATATPSPPVSPVVTTIYTLTVSNAAGDVVTQNITVTVVPPVSISGFTSAATADSITNSESTTLTGDFAGDADNTGVITNDQDASTINVTTLTPSAPVSPTVTTVYTLTVSNAAGDVVTQNLTVTVIDQPTLTLSASATTITSGNTVDLTAIIVSDSTTTGTITNDQDVTTINVTSGTPVTTPALTVSTTYSLTITNSLGFPVTKTINIGVITPPPPPSAVAFDFTTFSLMTRPITATTSITILFDQNMNASTLSLSGSLAGQTNNTTNSVFASFSLVTDKLTITPISGSWAPEIGATLTINVDSQAGGSLVPLTLIFDITSGTIRFVDDAIGASGDGLSPATAKQTITEALTGASSGDFIAVNEGVYSVDSAITPITLKSAIPIYGGYKNDFTDRDTVLFESIITDTSSAAGTATVPNSAILAPSGVTSSTVVDGFTINGSSNVTADFTSGILVTGGATPTIENNIISGGGDASNDTSYGIYVDSSDPIIRNNLIFGGSSINSYGLNLNTVTSALALRNNTISGGSGSTIATAISGSNAAAKVENNNVFSNGTGINTCYHEEDGTSPTTLDNNNLFCTVVYHDNNGGCAIDNDGDADVNTCTLDDMDTLLGANANNNVSIDSQLSSVNGVDGILKTMSDNDWRLSGTTPASVSAGGLNGIDAGFGFTKDLDVVTRPASGTPWSIGAYEP